MSSSPIWTALNENHLGSVRLAMFQIPGEYHLLVFGIGQSYSHWPAWKKQIANLVHCHAEWIAFISTFYPLVLLFYNSYKADLSGSCAFFVDPPLFASFQQQSTHPSCCMQAAAPRCWVSMPIWSPRPAKTSVQLGGWRDDEVMKIPTDSVGGWFNMLAIVI